MDQRERADKIEPMLAAEPIENAEASEPTEPTDRIEPAEPMDRIDPDEPIDRIDPLDPMLRTDPPDPGERDEPAEIRMRIILAGKVAGLRVVGHLLLLRSRSHAERHDSSPGRGQMSACISRGEPQGMVQAVGC